ncbi:MAG: hypothetical protein M1823_004007 [Watsoniomyces obsoletus]|nr:MAG: hypothetical protein M1823_004007 [Watsoniomyces obsoletus]
MSRSPSRADKEGEHRSTSAAAPQADRALPNGPARKRKVFVLCFDGTGNKFNGNEVDSNILKIFRLLDKTDDAQLHYYQPGIGTYVVSSSLSHTHLSERIKSWYAKAKDSAVGSSFDQHVIGGYRFLMRYYSPGDDMYFFGFSRGAYTARFLAEMLDHVGLLTPGSEELVRFAWKTFERWQQRRRSNGDDEDETETANLELFRFMKAFRETFSRPVRRIRFLGLLDCVNSVPRFEAAWMQRSKHPYTARSSAKVIRHAVAIDERRAKFRQDLVAGGSHLYEHRHHLHRPSHHHHHHHQHEGYRERQELRYRKRSVVGKTPVAGRAPSEQELSQIEAAGRIHRESRAIDGQLLGEEYRPRPRSKSRNTRSLRSISPGDTTSQYSLPPSDRVAYDSDDESPVETAQSIEEVWFPGGHADIGGGWELASDEQYALSHIPLVWMVREAQRAGLRFDEEKLRAMSCYDDRHEILQHSFGLVDGTHNVNQQLPRVLVTATSPTRDRAPAGWMPPPSSPQRQSTFVEALELAATHGRIHDCLSFNNGLPASSVLSWKIMEFLPFRRMDLRPDGSWKPIRWPLPRGEVRDIPENAQIHNSAIKRMATDEKYRPGNLIIGGGGRGVRFAPKHAGTGTWTVIRSQGDPVDEISTRKDPDKT